MRNHRDAHAVELTGMRIFRNDVDDLRHRHRRPVDPDEITIGIIPVGLPMAGQAAIGAIGATAFRVGQQQVQATRAFAAIHAPAHDAERDRGGRRQLHVFRRLHVRRKEVVVRQVHALGRDVVVLDVASVPAVDRRSQWQARLHDVERVEVPGR